MPTRKSGQHPDAAQAERLLQARLPGDLVKALRIRALEQDTTVKELLTRLVRDYVSRQAASSGRKA